MKIALVHDYLKEYGGAERVLKTLAEIYPNAPIYTAFSVKGSTAEKEFKDKEIYESWLAPLLKIDNLYSPLRFLTPLVWRSFDLSEYDLVITSCSWYITRGFEVGPKTKVMAYCHTPPRWLYGYETSVGFTKYWPVKVYSVIVGHFMRMYDFKTAQVPTKNKEQRTKNRKIRGGVNYFIANSKNVADRIKKFYRRDSTVIYPPVDVKNIIKSTGNPPSPRLRWTKEDYFLMVSRLVGAKGLEEAAKAFKNSKYKLKIVGEAHGFSDVEKRLKRLSGENVELIGRVSVEELYTLYANAKGFIALARDEDFGMTVVEAMAAGTPVIAFNGGGFKESVVDGITGVLINDTDETTLENAIERFNKIKWDRKKLQENAKRFSKERFEMELKEVISSKIK
ncbi:MAG: Mannosyl transferase [Candidatus Woesebacteria bacterium GW2011_GWA1_39_8]|nr:MAG: Mannosyl transferase [Candidatus Woesebacteria bacterium GW2011_GWA1_39_8]